MRNQLSIVLFYLIGSLILLGGIGDQFINGLLDVHHEYLGNPEPSELLTKASRLIILMLHALGGGLISAGIAVLVLTHFGIRKNMSWAFRAAIIISFIAQGFNGYGMFMAGSYYYYPATILVLTTIAAITYQPLLKKAE